MSGGQVDSWGDGYPVVCQYSGDFQTKYYVGNVNGKVGVPILLYFLGVPGIFVVIIWAFFFRGK